jgi:predicted Zn-ribbon and HTH transcriptional regulator
MKLINKIINGKFKQKEIKLNELNFNKFKFNKRKIPKDKNRIIFIDCFGEFGCESVALMFCIPRIIQRHPGAYFICVGWYGREYLYRHLVDEFWEIKEEFQWLREYANAFNNSSKNLAKLNSNLKNFGIIYDSKSMGSICLSRACRSCKNVWGDLKSDTPCPKCNSLDIEQGILHDIPYHKRLAVQIPRPSINHLNLAKKYLKPNSVGIFARGRALYGRNLPLDFYEKLIVLLKKNDFNPIWLGEKQSVLPCPVNDIIDFSRLPEARDLELTLAIIANLEFTIQFWTASTRLSSMVGTPWILFESPDQIVGHGQEGMRIALTTDFNKKKLVLANYKNVLEKQEETLFYVDKSIKEIYQNNWEDVIGPVESPQMIDIMLKKQELWR